jgi:cell division protein FtsQ
MKKWLLHIALVSVMIIFMGLLLLYRSAGVSHRASLKCTGLDICIIDSASNSFISAGEVKKYLDDEYGKYIGCRIDSLNLTNIEQLLKGKTAVLNSEAYLTKDGVLNITITQRKPVVRFVGKEGGFYADENGETFPLQKTYASYVPVIDGVIPSETDSIYIQKVVNLINFVERSEKWQNKIVQISADSTGNLTLIPREGDERFFFGQPEDIEAKMEKMEMYYSHIIPGKGDKTYRRVDLRYEDQIICK